LLDPTWVSPNGRLDFGVTPFDLPPTTLVNPSSLRGVIEAQGFTFNPGYTVFFLGNENRLLSVLRVGHRDTVTHRIFTVSLSPRGGIAQTKIYEFTEPLAFAQPVPTYTLGNLVNGQSPMAEIVLPDPYDSFAARSVRLDSSITLSRNGRDSLKFTLPILP
jgi:hypothetical protein